MKFTDKGISNLKQTDKKRYVRDVRQGFALRIMPSGVKTFLYIYTDNSKRRELNLGTYPEVTLSTALEKYQEAHNRLKNGIDPKYIEPTPTPPEHNTFKHFSDLYLAWSEQHHSTAWHKILKLSLINDVFPFWGNIDIKEIGRRDAIELLERVSNRSPGQVSNVHKAAQGVMDFALQREHLEYNPMLRLSRVVPDLKRPSKERVLTEEEIRHVWSSLDDTPTNRALKLILVTAQRPGEVAGLNTKEIAGDWWTIPKERAEKGKGDHIVYLTQTAKDLITPGYAINDLVFNVLRSSLSQHVSRKRKHFDLPAWTPHDLRRTARTFMAKIGIMDEHAEAVINHAKQGIKKVYNLYDYQEEKKAALIKWEAELLRIVS